MERSRRLDPEWSFFVGARGALLRCAQVHVLEKVIPVNCGKDPQQNVQWLGDVAIAKYSESTLDGWKRIGVVKEVATIDGIPLNAKDSIAAANLVNHSHLRVTPSPDNL